MDEELAKKVDKAEGKGLSTNDYTNDDKRLVNEVLPASVNENAAKIEEIRSQKVDKVEGKGLSTNDYTDSAKELLETWMPQEFDRITERVETAEANAYNNYLKKVDKVEGKGLSTNDYTDEDKAEVAKIAEKADISNPLSLSDTDKTKDIVLIQHNYDSETSTGKYVGRSIDINNLSESGLNAYNIPTSKAVAQYVQSSVSNKVDKVEGKGLSTNDYTDEDKDKLDTLLYAVDINSQAIANVNERKVDKVEGKGLSTNDYTNEERDSLDKLSKKFELVEQFTLTEDVTQIYRSQKPNGEVYNFNDVIMTLSIPIIEEGSTEAYGGTFMYIVNSETDTANNRVVAQGGVFKKGQVGNISVRAKIEGGIVFGAYGASAGNRSNKQAAFTSYSNISMLSAEKITSVLFTFFGQTIFSGTIIKIYAR